jgi:predicted site-specific integrase-resolvase
MPRYSDRVNLKQWAQRQGVSYATERRWSAAGKLPVPAWRTGGLIVAGEPAVGGPGGLTAVYARVWSADRPADLGRHLGLYGRRAAVGRAQRAVVAVTASAP